MGDGLANALVLQDIRLQVEEDLVLLAGVGIILAQNRETRILLEAGQIGERNRSTAAEIQITGLEGGGAGGGIGHEADDHAIEIGLRLVPVVRIAFEDGMAAAHPFLEHEGTGADEHRRSRRSCDIDALVQVLWHDRRFGRTECNDQVGCRLRQNEFERIRVRGVGFHDVGKGAATARMAGFQPQDRECGVSG